MSGLEKVRYYNALARLEYNVGSDNGSPASQLSLPARSTETSFPAFAHVDRTRSTVIGSKFEHEPAFPIWCFVLIIISAIIGSDMASCTA
ncbi:hypothetical protein V2J09_019909 [Rumex salicifolius]